MRREMEKLSEHASLYDESNANGNVIIIEAYSPHWNGFGNNMSRYLTLFMVALRFVSFATISISARADGKNTEGQRRTTASKERRLKDEEIPCTCNPRVNLTQGCTLKEQISIGTGRQNGERKSRTVRVSENDEKRNDFMRRRRRRQR